MKNLIMQHGGSSAFARLTGIPLRTIQEWKAGRRNPPPWLLPILTEWIEGKKMKTILNRMLQAESN